jgi:hypothetical protein
MWWQTQTQGGGLYTTHWLCTNAFEVVPYSSQSRFYQSHNVWLTSGSWCHCSSVLLIAFSRPTAGRASVAAGTAVAAAGPPAGQVGHVSGQCLVEHSPSPQLCASLGGVWDDSFAASDAEAGGKCLEASRYSLWLRVS